MDDQSRPRPDEKQAAPAEGVRIIGPDEAAEAMERGDVASRRSGDELRFGDRPPAPPAGPRPALRFPLDASADPTRIERPPVQPAPDPVTGPVELPHWTEPPTGEVPAVLIGDDAPLLAEDGDDSDAWSSFATSTPRWRDADDDWGDDGFMERLANDGDELRVGALGNQDDEPSHEEYFGFDDLEERVEERTGEGSDPGPRFETGDDDWSASADAPAGADAPAAGDWPADEGWSDSDDDWADETSTEASQPGENDDDLYRGPGGQQMMPEQGDSGGRDMKVASVVAIGLAALLIGAVWLGAAYAAVLVAGVLTLAAGEYFGVLRKVGWEAATLLGIGATALFPLAVYWRGVEAFPLLVFLLIVAIMSWYLVGAGGGDPRVLEGTGATLLGVLWVGGLGSTATAMLRIPDGRALFVTAALATIAYDIGGLFIGRAMGNRRLSAASPNKTLEGLVGGMASAVVVTIVVVGVMSSGPWTGPMAAIVLGLGAAFAAPLGDLCQSLLKRDLGVKDMSSILPGHGGLLDRLDGMLFVFPTVFWLAVAFGPIG